MRTITMTLRAAPEHVGAVVRALEAGGYPVRVDPTWVDPDGRQYLEVQDMVPTASAEEQRGFHEHIVGLLREAAVEADHAGSGVVVAGGTSFHRWIAVALNGEPVARILAADDADIARQLPDIAEAFGVSVDDLECARPDPWPAIPGD
ncbi:hypothetical protein ICW40_01240 [Actinotalea ferrariae]|uniref:hypothetical protein n=1 Tax=Actinotalea ferrariae TaxID=1386098 RepID=UPI001C8BFB16|nr:hypothetical protein [Actinotalea ferrariae]MBX9243430.1 hypothetical protein [Actinotalea ferrariae]